MSNRRVHIFETIEKVSIGRMETYVRAAELRHAASTKQNEHERIGIFHYMIKRYLCSTAINIDWIVIRLIKSF